MIFHTAEFFSCFVVLGVGKIKRLVSFPLKNYQVFLILAHASAGENLENHSSHNVVVLSEMYWKLRESVREVLVKGQGVAFVLQAVKALRDWDDGCCILPSICISTGLEVPEL